MFFIVVVLTVPSLGALSHPLGENTAFLVKAALQHLGAPKRLEMVTFGGVMDRDSNGVEPK